MKTKVRPERKKEQREGGGYSESRGGGGRAEERSDYFESGCGIESAKDWGEGHQEFLS